MKHKLTLYTMPIMLLFSSSIQAQEANTDKWYAFSTDFLLEYTFATIAVVLLVVIFLLGRFYAKLLTKKGEAWMTKNSKTGLSVIALGLMLLLPDVAEASTGSLVLMNVTSNMTYTTFFVIALVILLELFVIVFLIRNIYDLLGFREDTTTAKEDTTPDFAEVFMAKAGVIWTKINAFKSKEKEKEVLLDHDYDGIKELDNDLPPWWVWGFYITIIFSVIYLWRYHVAQTAPLQAEELEIAIAKEEERMKAYRASAALAVDESNVEVVDDKDFIEKGRLVYMSNCVACHGNYGEGGVGPNLTDEYWIHGGSVSDIFTVVKYGVVEKGMTPWKDLLSPMQIAQVSNYVLTLEGTEPPNPKEPQGEKYIRSEEGDDQEDTEEAVEM